LVLGVAALAILFFAFRNEIAEWSSRIFSTFTTVDEFREWVEGFGAWGPLVFFLAQAVQVVIVPIPGALFPPAGSLAFGPWPALLLSLAGMAVGSALVFLAARTWGRPLAVRLAGEGNLSRYGRLIESRGSILLWLVFLLPLLPDDAMCALAGISRISFRRFMLIAVVGRIPAVVAGVFAMAGLERAPGWVWFAVSVGLVLLVLGGSKLRAALERSLANDQPIIDAGSPEDRDYPDDELTRGKRGA
jgi:uncharacterized membrane protein YdjX (TVP38/TMEM64 family)